jgi:predicted MPP superfamily phosphohydrolase
MQVLYVLLAAFVVIGHGALCVAAINRVHAMSFPRWVIHTFNRIALTFCVGVPLLMAYLAWSHGMHIIGPDALDEFPWGVLFYFGVCAIVGLVLVPLELVRRWTERWPTSIVRQSTTTHNLRERVGAAPAHGLKGRLLCSLPFNEVFDLTVTEKHLEFENLPAELEGFSIAHLSDLHYTGTMTERFYEEVANIVSGLQADMICVTGDIVEKPKCWPWITRTLGRLRARYGVYYVLGNHDVQIDVRRTRTELDAAGLIDMGSRTREVDINGAAILLAGNELPWLAPAADMSQHPAPIDGEDERRPRTFRLLLSHSPDQLPWARKHRFDLMLAGHTHGGQVVLPVIGGLLCPSRFGIRYSAGTFAFGPMVMHVSRGVAGETPLRWNCPPEVTRLVLTCAPRQSDSVLANAASTTTS